MNNFNTFNTMKKWIPPLLLLREHRSVIVGWCECVLKKGRWDQNGGIETKLCLQCKLIN